MESSMLLTDEINIEDERFQLQLSGFSWIETKDMLISKYRESSKKRLFRCRCCDSTTHMVLSEGKVCCFKHRSNQECAGSRNYKRYISVTAGLEHQKHRVGKAIIKDQLWVNLARTGANVIDGYLYKAELSFVPDLVVEWPNGQIWTFDYVTGTKSSQYQRYLLNKQAAYRQNNYRSYFLFDHSQIAKKQEQKALALSEGEKGSLQFLSDDLLWEGLLLDLAERYGDESLVQDSRLKLKDMKVKQLLYVTDDIKGIFYKLSQLQIRPFLNMNEIP